MKPATFWRALGCIVLLAFLLRGLYFAYNHHVNANSTWTWQARAALHAAKRMVGEGSPTPGVGDQDADFMFAHGVNGQTYLHLFLYRIAGQSSYAHIQMLQLGLDGCLTLAVVLIGVLIGDRMVGLVAGLAYAVFLPQMWLAIVPGYDFWASAGFLASTCLFLWGIHKAESQPWMSLGWLFLGAWLAALAACVRPTVLLYPFSFGFLHLMLGRGPWPTRVTGTAVLGVGTFLGHLPVLIHNYVTYGSAWRTPNVTIHQFWCGVGQYPNPYNVQDDDGSIREFYERLTGKTGPEYQYHEDYVRVLKREASAYLQAHPFHYAACVARRALHMLSGIGLRQARLDADVWKDHSEIVARRTLREQYITAHGFVVGVLLYLFRHLHLYTFYPLLVVPVLGFVAALVWERRALVWLAACPLLYSIAVFAPFYYCERCVIAAYAATLPVWVLGMSSLGIRLRRAKLLVATER